MTARRLCIIFFLSAALALWSCKDQVTQPSQSPIVFPASNISYSKYIDPLFQRQCAVGGCHSNTTAAGDLDLTIPSYDNLMFHQPRLVVSGASNNSLLVQRLDGRIQPVMPPIQSPLTSNQINGIKKWIDEGALNN
jgi:hypothetical protein